MADNCEPRKIDSNRTGLYFAETICGRLPTIAEDGRLPIWYEREPNSYDALGGSLTTTARRPINASRQRKKGTVTDLTAGGGFNEDFTQSNFTRLLQGFFFANAREKASTDPLNGDLVILTGVDTTGADTYIAAGGGLSRFSRGQLVMASGFENAVNNGIREITAVADTMVAVGSVLANEAMAPATAKLQTIGWRLPVSGASIVMLGNVPQLVLAADPLAASGTIEIANVVADDIVSIGGIDYIFTSAIVASYDVLIGATPTETAANLAASINGNVLNTPAHPFVRASAATGTVTLTAVVSGETGNDIELSADADDVTVSAPKLAGGTGFSFNALGVIPGEWVYLGSDSAVNTFANNHGYARIVGITDKVLTFDKTTWQAVNETGAGIAVDIFVGTTILNEKNEDDIVTHYYEIMRTLGRDADGVQSEYLTRSVANEFTLNVPLPEGEDAKLTADLSFISGDNEQRTGAEGLKEGVRVAAASEEAINTASNIVRIRMSLVDPTTSRPLPLFAYVVETTITINNNVTPAKAISVLGAYDVNVGDFDAGGEVTAVFSTVEATRAVRNNADVSLDMIAAAKNAGFVYDFPLLTLGGGSVEVEPGQEIRVPLEMYGAENDAGYTLLYTNWPYLPTQAMPKQGGAY